MKGMLQDFAKAAEPEQHRLARLATIIAPVAVGESLIGLMVATEDLANRLPRSSTI
jgi:hypothetical protein